MTMLLFILIGDTMLTFILEYTNVYAFNTTPATAIVCFIRVSCPSPSALCYLNSVLLYSIYACRDNGIVDDGFTHVALNCSIDDVYVALLTLR